MKLIESIDKGTTKLSGFDLSFDGVLSQNWGELVPIVCKEMIPGDSFNCSAHAFIRLAPLASPTYGRIHGYINYFFVPNRILCADRLWEDFIRGGVTGDDVFELPYLSSDIIGDVCNELNREAEQETNPEYQKMKFARVKGLRKLATYLGLCDPTQMNTGIGIHFNALPYLAYNRIYGDYYYPWGLSEYDDSTAEEIYFARHDEGLIDVSNNLLFRQLLDLKHACFKKDYLTTAQIHPQRGKQARANMAGTNNDIQVVDADNTPQNTNNGITALAMNWANALQSFLERNNIAGARYFEQILARFGVKIEAERLDRSEYLGGNDFYINISDVTSTAGVYGGSSLGELAGKGVGLGQGSISYTARDYGFFFAILHIMPESGVVQGLNRMWSRLDRFDYFIPEFEKTGMQPIYNVEVFQDYYLNDPAGTDAYDSVQKTGVFGYIPRYAEYKYSSPLLAGDFRLSEPWESQLSNDMNSMHLYRLFNADFGPQYESDTPVLSPLWLQLDNQKHGEFNRIFQDTNDDFDHFWTNIQVSLAASRPMLGYIEASSAFAVKDGAKVSVPVFGTRL